MRFLKTGRYILEISAGMGIHSLLNFDSPMYFFTLFVTLFIVAIIAVDVIVNKDA